MVGRGRPEITPFEPDLVRASVGKGSPHPSRTPPPLSGSDHERALAVLSDNPTARTGVATIALQQGRHQESVERLEAILEERSDLAEIWNLLGAARSALGQPADARVAFKHALETDPFYPEALANAGLLRHRRRGSQHSSAPAGDSVALRRS